MEKYEYEYMVTSIIIDKADEISKALSGRFNKEGYDGWELVQWNLMPPTALFNSNYDTLLWFNMYSCNI